MKHGHGRFLVEDSHSVGDSCGDRVSPGGRGVGGVQGFRLAFSSDELQLATLDADGALCEFVLPGLAGGGGGDADDEVVLPALAGAGSVVVPTTRS